MNDEDYAVVVGIRRYPMLGRTAQDPNDLQGPDRDAQEVYDWLTDPNKGGVPTANATLIRSQMYPDPFEQPVADNAKPREAEILSAFRNLVQLAAAKGTQRVGRRLYLFASGHGFAKDRQEGALVLADATRMTLSQSHMTMSDWAKWFARSGRFDEVVLWMDCCMDEYGTAFLRPGGFDNSMLTDGGGKVFAAFAAKYPRRSIEHPFPPNNEYRGVFTYMLLQGLNGIAVDSETKQITSVDLKNHLTRAMNAFMKEHYPNDGDVSPDPDFGSVEDLVFRKFDVTPEVPKQSYDLQLPVEAVGKTVQIKTGSPPETVESRQVASTTETFLLPMGAYVAIISEPGGMSWQGGFIVVGGANV